MRSWKLLGARGGRHRGRRRVGASPHARAASQPAAQQEDVTLIWWHNATRASGLKRSGQQVADEFHAAAPGVTIKAVPVQNEQFTTKIPIALQSDDPPDVFQQWGGGQLVDQVEGRQGRWTSRSTSKPWIKSIGGSAAGWQFNGKQYGDPVQPRDRGVLVQQGALRAGRDQVAAEDLAAVPGRRSRS